MIRSEEVGDFGLGISSRASSSWRPYLRLAAINLLRIWILLVASAVIQQKFKIRVRSL